MLEKSIKHGVSPLSFGEGTGGEVISACSFWLSSLEAYSLVAHGLVAQQLSSSATQNLTNKILINFSLAGRNSPFG